MDLVFPGQYDSIVATPLQVFGRGLDARIVLGQAVLEVAADDPDLSILCVESDEFGVGSNRDELEGAVLQLAVLSFRGINDDDGVVDCQDGFDGARQGKGGRDDSPGQDFTFWRSGQESRTRFVVARDTDELVVAEESNESRGPEAARDDTVLVGAVA
jgi:hypothetical protein